MPYYTLHYTLVPDYLARRPALRAEHLALAEAYVARGALVLAGAYRDPSDGALLVFEAEDESVVEAFAKTDPYVRHGLVTAWRVREWVAVAGTGIKKA